MDKKEKPKVRIKGDEDRIKKIKVSDDNGILMLLDSYQSRVSNSNNSEETLPKITVWLYENCALDLEAAEGEWKIGSSNQPIKLNIGDAEVKGKKFSGGGEVKITGKGGFYATILEGNECSFNLLNGGYVRIKNIKVEKAEATLKNSTVEFFDGNITTLQAWLYDTTCRLNTANVVIVRLELSHNPPLTEGQESNGNIVGSGNTIINGPLGKGSSMQFNQTKVNGNGNIVGSGNTIINGPLGKGSSVQFNQTKVNGNGNIVGSGNRQDIRMAINQGSGSTTIQYFNQNVAYKSIGKVVNCSRSGSTTTQNMAASNGGQSREDCNIF